MSRSVHNNGVSTENGTLSNIGEFMRNFIAVLLVFVSASVFAADRLLLDATCTLDCGFSFMDKYKTNYIDFIGQTRAEIENKLKCTTDMTFNPTSHYSDDVVVKGKNCTFFKH
jgi:hypothetical protein